MEKDERKTSTSQETNGITSMAMTIMTMTIMTMTKKMLCSSHVPQDLGGAVVAVVATTTTTTTTKTTNKNLPLLVMTRPPFKTDVRQEFGK